MAEMHEWANAYLFSAPRRYGVSASQLRAFIDTLGPLWSQGKLSNKAVTAMSSAMNPYGVSGTANGQPIPDDVNEAIKYQARRLVFFAETRAR